MRCVRRGPLAPLLVVVAGLAALVGVADRADGSGATGIPPASMRDLLHWGRRVGVPPSAWEALDAVHVAYLTQVVELDRSVGPLGELGRRRVTDAAGLADLERDRLRRMDRFLHEEDRLADGLRGALESAMSSGAATGVLGASPDAAAAVWRAQRLFGAIEAFQSPSYYGGVRVQLPDLDALRLTQSERLAAEAALGAHLPDLAERARAHLRARARFRALESWLPIYETAETGELVVVEPAGRAEASAELVAVARRSRMALMRSQQAARQAIVASLPEARREEASRALLAQVAPGVRYTRMGAIAEALVPYLSDLDDRTQRKLETKIRQLRAELQAAERAKTEELERAIASGDFEAMVRAGDGFEAAMEELAEREGRGMVTLIGQRNLEPMIGLELGQIEGDDASQTLARLMPADRVEEFLIVLAARDPQAAERLRQLSPPARAFAGTLLAQAAPPSPGLRIAIESPVRGEALALRQVRAALESHERAWREQVQPSQRKLLDLLGMSGPDDRPALGPTLRFEAGQVKLESELDLPAAEQALGDLESRIAGVELALMDSLAAVLVARAPVELERIRSDRAQELFASWSEFPLAMVNDPLLAEPVDVVAALDDAGLSADERGAALLVASEALSGYAEALRDRLNLLSRAALLSRHIGEESLRAGRGWFFSGQGEAHAPEQQRRLERMRSLREDAGVRWRAGMKDVFEVWSEILPPEAMDRVRQAALIRAYPGVSRELLPLRGVVEECMATIQRLPAEDPRRVLAAAIAEARQQEARQRVLALAEVVERRAAVPSGMVEPRGRPIASAEGGPGSASVTSSTGMVLVQPEQVAQNPSLLPRWKADLDELAVRTARDLWLAVGDDAVLEGPQVRNLLRSRRQEE